MGLSNFLDRVFWFVSYQFPHIFVIFFFICINLSPNNSHNFLAKTKRKFTLSHWIWHTICRRHLPQSRIHGRSRSRDFGGHCHCNSGILGLRIRRRGLPKPLSYCTKFQFYDGCIASLGFLGLKVGSLKVVLISKSPTMWHIIISVNNSISPRNEGRHSICPGLIASMGASKIHKFHFFGSGKFHLRNVGSPQRCHHSSQAMPRDPNFVVWVFVFEGEKIILKLGN